MYFLQAVLLGGALGFLYDVFRIIRIAIPTKNWVTFLEDVFFFLCAAVFTFFFLMQTTFGQVRFFIIVGECIGATLYFMAVSPIIMKISSTIIKVVRQIVRLILQWLVLPILRLIRTIVDTILRPVLFVVYFVKKSAQRCNYRLKVRAKVLYNQLGSVFTPNKRKYRRKSRSHGSKKAKKIRSSKANKIPHA